MGIEVGLGDYVILTRLAAGPALFSPGHFLLSSRSDKKLEEREEQTKLLLPFLPTTSSSAVRCLGLQGIAPSRSTCIYPTATSLFNRPPTVLRALFPFEYHPRHHYFEPPSTRLVPISPFPPVWSEPSEYSHSSSAPSFPFPSRALALARRWLFRSPITWPLCTCPRAAQIAGR